MTGPTLSGLALVRDQLGEARRFTHTDPYASGAWLEQALHNLAIAHQQIDGDRVVPITCISRVCRNLAVGFDCMAAAPDVTDAYITGAIWELGDLASRLRKEGETEERDAEMMAAYGPKATDTTEGGATDGIDR